MSIICLGFIALSLLLAAPGCLLVRQLGIRLGQIDLPGGRKTHDRPIPATGGIALFWSIALPLLSGLAAASFLPEDFWSGWLSPIRPHLPGILQQRPMTLALLAGLGLLHGLGLIDDRKNLGPWSKLTCQFLAAGIMVIGFHVRVMEWWGEPASIAVSLLWLVAITNAFNFLDNMDGLSAGTGLIAAGIFLAAALLSGQWFVAAVLALLIGALAGFLIYNFPPATLFMGDGGSLVVGFLLGFCSLRLTWHDPTQGTGWWAVFTPLIVLAVPLYDFTSVTLLRLIQGRSPFVGDTQHFSHRLVKRGLSRRAAVTIIWASTLASGLGGVMLARLQEAWQGLLVLGQTLAILLVLALLERSGLGNGSSTSTGNSGRET